MIEGWDWVLCLSSANNLTLHEQKFCYFDKSATWRQRHQRVSQEVEPCCDVTVQKTFKQYEVTTALFQNTWDKENHREKVFFFVLLWVIYFVLHLLLTMHPWNQGFCFQSHFWAFFVALMDRIAETGREGATTCCKGPWIPGPLQRGRTPVAPVEMKKTKLVIWRRRQSLLDKPLFSTPPPSDSAQSGALHPPADGAVSTCLIIRTQLISPHLHLPPSLTLWQCESYLDFTQPFCGFSQLESISVVPALMQVQLIQNLRHLQHVGQSWAVKHGETLHWSVPWWKINTWITIYKPTLIRSSIVLNVNTHSMSVYVSYVWVWSERNH